MKKHLKKINHLSGKIGFQTEEAKKFPSVILIASASPCNLRCHACPCTHIPSIRDTTGSNGKKKLFLEPDLYKTITDECASHSSENFHPRIRISGYGEPLLNTDIVDMIEYSCSSDIKTSLITNGLLLTQSKTERLIKAGLESIEISADAHEKKLYAQMRIGGDFDELKQNIKDLIKIRNAKQTSKQTLIMVSIVRTTHNHKKISEIESFWKQMGVDRVNVRNFLTWGIPALQDMQKQLNQETYLHKNSPCPYPFERLMIDPSGWVRLCPYDDQKKIPDFGHASETTISNIWNGERLNRIRNCHKEKFNHHLAVKNAPLCSECEDRLNRSWTHNYLSIARQETNK